MKMNISFDEVVASLKDAGFAVVDRAWLTQKEKDADEVTELRQELRGANFKINVLNDRLNKIAEFAESLSEVGDVINQVKELAEE